MPSRLFSVSLVALALAATVTGIARSAGERPPEAPSPAAGGTLILTVEIDHQGVRVLHATRKPALAFRAPRHAAESDFGWALLGADGTTLAASGFDPHRLCLDPAHAGQKPHMDGDQIVPHVGHCNVKIPDLDDAKTIAFTWRENGEPRAFGSTALDTLTVR